MLKKVILTGATGLIGKKIFSKLKEKKYEIIIFSRDAERAEKIIPGADEYVNWDIPRMRMHPLRQSGREASHIAGSEFSETGSLQNKHNWEKYLEGTHAVIHLAGENIMAKRWTAKHKKKILESRIFGTRALVNGIKNTQNKPEVFICASAVGYYGNSENEVDENSPPGTGFLVDVVKKWEDEASAVESYNVRWVSIRMGVVLDKNEGALAKMLIPFKFFVGGTLGSGTQWFPWIHIEDAAGMFLHVLENNRVHGAVNSVSPHPVRMKEFCNILGQVMHRPSFFNVPEFVLKIILGEAAGTVLDGAKVMPQKAISSGYKFTFEHLENALKNILKNKS